MDNLTESPCLNTIHFFYFQKFTLLKEHWQDSMSSDNKISYKFPKSGWYYLCDKSEFDLKKHIRTEHSDEIPELIAALMVQISELKRQQRHDL